MWLEAMVLDGAALDFPKRLMSLPGLFGGGGRVTRRLVDFERTHVGLQSQTRSSGGLSQPP